MRKHVVPETQSGQTFRHSQCHTFTHSGWTTDHFLLGVIAAPDESAWTCNNGVLMGNAAHTNNNENIKINSDNNINLDT